MSDPGSIVAERIAPALAPLIVPIDSLITHPRNPRQGDVGAISESLRVFGQQKPIVAQRSAEGRHVIIAGNHLYLAARELRWESIACVLVDLDDATATRFMLADNRTSQLGTFDQNVLGEVLRELAAADLLEATGYDGDDVDAILRRIAAPQDFVDFTATESDFRCPSCGYEWTGPAK